MIFSFQSIHLLLSISIYKNCLQVFLIIIIILQLQMVRQELDRAKRARKTAQRLPIKRRLRRNSQLSTLRSLHAQHERMVDQQSMIEAPQRAEQLLPDDPNPSYRVTSQPEVRSNPHLPYSLLAAEHTTFTSIPLSQQIENQSVRAHASEAVVAEEALREEAGSSWLHYEWQPEDHYSPFMQEESSGDDIWRPRDPWFYTSRAYHSDSQDSTPMDYFTRREEQDLTIKEPPKQELEQIVEKEAEQEVENEVEWEDDLAEFYMNVRKV